MSLSSELVELLICPLCGEAVSLSDDKTCILCYNCRVRYRIDNDIPILVVDESEKMPS